MREKDGWLYTTIENASNSTYPLPSSLIIIIITIIIICRSLFSSSNSSVTKTFFFFKKGRAFIACVHTRWWRIQRARWHLRALIDEPPRDWLGLPCSQTSIIDTLIVYHMWMFEWMFGCITGWRVPEFFRLRVRRPSSALHTQSLKSTQHFFFAWCWDLICTTRIRVCVYICIYTHNALYALSKRVCFAYLISCFHFDFSYNNVFSSFFVCIYMQMVTSCEKCPCEPFKDYATRK